MRGKNNVELGGLWNNLPWKSFWGPERNPSRRSSYVLFSAREHPPPLLSCHALKNPEKYASGGIWELQRKDWLIRLCLWIPALVFCWVSFACANAISARQIQRKIDFHTKPSVNNVASLVFASHLKYSKDFIKIWLRLLLSQMSRRAIKSLLHCHQDIVRKGSSLNFQCFHSMLNCIVSISWDFFI